MVYALLIVAALCFIAALRGTIAKLIVYPAQRHFIAVDDTVDLMLSLLSQPEGWEHDDWRIYHPATNVDIWTHSGERGMAINIGKGVGAIIPSQGGNLPLRGFERNLLWRSVEALRNGVPNQTIIDFAVASQKFAETLRIREDERKAAERQFIDQTNPNRY